MEFCDRFRQLRKERGIGQNQLAQALGTSNASISYWETGRSEPTLYFLKRIAIFFDVSSDYLLGLETEDGTKITQK